MCRQLINIGSKNAIKLTIEMIKKRRLKILNRYFKRKKENTKREINVA